MSKFTAAIHAPYTQADLWLERGAAMVTFATAAGVVSLLLWTIAA